MELGLALGIRNEFTDDRAMRNKPVARYFSECELREGLLKSSEDVFKILLLQQEFSLSPLMCTELAMLNIIQSWSVGSMFTDMISKFGDQPQIFDESSGFRQFYRQSDGSWELCYQFMYIERNGKELPRNPWSYRQTGVYHKFSIINGSSQIIVINPNDEAVAQSRLEKYTESSHRDELAKHPLNVHLVVLSSYLVNWGEYIEDLARDLEQIRRVIDVVKADASQDGTVINPERLQTLRHLEDKVVCKSTRCLQSTRAIIRTLTDVNSMVPKYDNPTIGVWHSIEQELRQFEQRLEGHINSLEILATRVQATLGLLTNLLDIENQAISNKINSHMLELTRDNVDDNATVRVITVCTLIYLPASFMASVLGMNLFQFRESDKALTISPQFWIYIATTLPLTVITVGAWYLYKERQDRKRRNKYEIGNV